ncbi:hypothetical protein TrispH2_012052, partial [Trichoplax sp. H2]
FYNRVVNVPEDTYRNKVELSKAFYGIGKAHLEKSRFKTAKENLVKSKEILNGISNHRRLLIADIRDEIAKLYKSLNKLDASKKEYMESLKFRKEICDKHEIDFVRSYYSETRWEKYIRSSDSILALDRSCLVDIKKQKPYEEMKTAYHKLRKIYKLLSGRPYSLINRDNNGNNGNSCNEQDIEDFQWLKDEIDKIAKFIEKPLGSNEGNDGETNVRIRSDNSSDHPGIRIRAYSESDDEGYWQQMASRKIFISSKTKRKYRQCVVTGLLLTSSSSDYSESELSEQKTTARKSVSVKVRDKSSILTIARTAIREFKEAFETALVRGEFSNNFANIMLIGPNHEDKSFIYKLLTKQPESSPNATTVLINLDTIKQASNSDEKIIFDRQSFIDNKVLSVIEKQGNISPNPELQRIFSAALEIGNNQSSDKSRIAISSSDKIIDDKIDIDYPVNNNDNEITTASDNIISLLNETTKSLSSPSFSRCFQKFHQRRKYYHANQFAKIWNFNNHAYYQPFKFQHNVYIAPFDVSVKLDKIVSSDYGVGRHDYMTSFQEWLINAIDWNTKENQSYISIDSQEDEIPLPIILFVATNSDDKLTEEAQW